MAAKKHDENRGVKLEGQERIRELEQGGAEAAHGPHNGPLATESEPSPEARRVAGDPGNWRAPEDDHSDQDEFGNPPDPKEKKIGSKHGFIMSSEREHNPDNSSYEHTGSDNREGMGSGTQAGPAHQGHSKPQREGRPDDEESGV